MLTLHHLDYSRGTRILWLLEELALPYELVRYPRTPQFAAPDTLKAAHPLGKSPAIVDGDLVLAESATILRYLHDRHGNGQFTPPADTVAHGLHEEWLDYVESTAGFPIMLALVGGMLGGLSEALNKFAKDRVTRTLDYLQAGIIGPFLMGEQLTLADMQMTYVLDMADHAGLLADHPAIVAYLNRLKAVPGLQRAIERGGPMVPPR